MKHKIKGTMSGIILIFVLLGVFFFREYSSSKEIKELSEKNIQLQEENVKLQKKIDTAFPKYTVTECEDKIMYCGNENCQVMSHPGLMSSYWGITTVAYLDSLSKVYVTGETDNGYYRIRTRGGTRGYVKRDKLEYSLREFSLYAAEIGIIPTDFQKTCIEQQGTEEEEQVLIEEILEEILTEEMDDYAIAEAVNKYLCEHVEYKEYENFWQEGRTSFYTLSKGEGVCQGYANAFARLMNTAGVMTDTCVGERHVWNRSFIQGRYYYTDVTWNDTGDSMTEYLLISYDEMQKNHKQDLVDSDYVSSMNKREEDTYFPFW